jgi:hypothetical protein
MKLTEWYPSHILPVRHGVYKTKHLVYDSLRPVPLVAKEGYSYWCGYWSYTAKDAAWAERIAKPSQIQNKQWQGVTNEHQTDAS